MEMYPIERHLRVRTIKRPRFGPDGDSIYFRWNQTGNDEVWEIASPREWPKRTTFTGGITFAAWSPSGDEIAFGRAGTSHKRAQLHVLHDETGTVTQLTDEPEVAHRWGGWNRDGTAFAYAANRRRSGRFDVYTQGRDETSDDARLVYEQQRTSPVYPVGWGPENERLLVREIHSNFNSDIHLIDLQGGTARRLTSGPENQTRYRSLRWGPGGERLYLVTDLGHDWPYIASLHIASEEIEPVVQVTGNIDEIVLHRELGTIAFRKTKNGFTDVVTGTLTSPTDVETFPAPDLPSGAGKSLTMSSDGERLAVLFSTPTDAPDVYCIDVESGQVTRWTDVSQPVPSDNFASPQPVSYESFDGLEIPAFYVAPSRDGTDPLPAVISLHSGPRQHNSPAFDPLRQYYVEQGFVRLEPDYRGSSGHGAEYMEIDDPADRLDAIRDVKVAADWLAEKDAVDGSRIVLRGWSYGGFLVLAALTRWPDRFAAGAAISPIANFETYLESVSQERRQNREAEYGSLQDDRKTLRKLSPVHDVDRLTTPLLVAHGVEDRKVPVEETRQFAEEAREHDAPVETLFLDDAGHGFDSHENKLKLFERVTSFLATHT